MSTFQSAEVTATTDANGYFSFSFDSGIDKVMASANAPQAGGTGVGVVAATAVITGARSVKVRAWVTATGWTVQPAVSEQVTVTLLGITG